MHEKRLTRSEVTQHAEAIPIELSSREAEEISRACDVWLRARMSPAQVRIANRVQESRMRGAFRTRDGRAAQTNTGGTL